MLAFVLGGGGMLGAHEVGMLRALLERRIQPDLVLGTSVGALNGALVAADPTPAGARRLAEIWNEISESDVFGGSALARLGRLARTGTHLHSAEPLRGLIEERLEVELIEELPVRFGCVAASIERAAEHWFDAGPIADAVLASAAAPGLLPPVEIDGEHFLDGGLVNSIPISRAVALGARTVYVLQVGRIEQPLSAPRWPWEVGLVAFEIARRHRFAADLANLPDGVTVHLLPTGSEQPIRYNDLRQLRYRRFGDVQDRIESSYEATLAYLETDGGS